MKRHFVAQAGSVGIAKDEAIKIIDGIILATPLVIKDVYSLLPKGFNKSLADSILQGMRTQAMKLEKMPTEIL